MRIFANLNELKAAAGEHFGYTERQVVTQEQVDLIVHDNAVRLFGLTPEGLWRP